jgi:hypothetical protein
MKGHSFQGAGPGLAEFAERITGGS